MLLQLIFRWSHDAGLGTIVFNNQHTIIMLMIVFPLPTSPCEVHDSFARFAVDSNFFDHFSRHP